MIFVTPLLICMLVFLGCISTRRVGSIALAASHTSPFPLASAFSSIPSGTSMDTLIRQIIPPFNTPLKEKLQHKGSHGKVLVVGGSFEYTGAPFYAAAAALKTGCDLSWIMCSETAGVPIKTYSPEIIVHPSLPSSSSSSSISTTSSSSSVDNSHDSVQAAIKAFEVLAPRLDAVVFGPGLGRDPVALSAATGILKVILRRKIPVVVDGDGLFLLSENPGLLQPAAVAEEAAAEEEQETDESKVAPASSPPSIVLTPNVVEFKRLWDAVFGNTSTSSKSSQSDDDTTATLQLSAKLGRVTIVRKGAVDVIAASLRVNKKKLMTKNSTQNSISGNDDDDDDNNRERGITTTVSGIGSPRRCGGQGDVLAGSIGTFLAWAKGRGLLLTPTPVATVATTSTSTTITGAGEQRQLTAPAIAQQQTEVLVACARGGALLTRRAAQLAFGKHKRSTTTPDIVASIGDAFEAQFPGTLYSLYDDEEKGSAK